jgi:hypothetical protein
MAHLEFILGVQENFNPSTTLRVTKRDVMLSLSKHMGRLTQALRQAQSDNTQ